MPDIVLMYDNRIIRVIDESISLDIKTAGKYADGDIRLVYTKPRARVGANAVFQMSDFFAKFAPTATAEEYTE